jgi:hypothetical protein
MTDIVERLLPKLRSNECSLEWERQAAEEIERLRAVEKIETEHRERAAAQQLKQHDKIIQLQRVLNLLAVEDSDDTKPLQNMSGVRRVSVQYECEGYSRVFYDPQGKWWLVPTTKLNDLMRKYPLIYQDLCDQVACGTCEGTGEGPGDCPDCNGTGWRLS